MPPKLMPMATTTRPIIRGARLAPGGTLSSSVMASTSNSRRAVPMTWSRNPACGHAGKAGKVVKTPAVLSNWGSTWWNAGR